MRLRTLTRLLVILPALAGLTLLALGWHVAQSSGDPYPRSLLPEQAAPRTPSLYTNANSADVFARPDRHLGAHVELTATVLGVQRTGKTVVIAARVGRRPLVFRVFDDAFRAHRGDTIHVRGTVRGPLGDQRHVPGLRPSPTLAAGLAVVDAAAASSR